MPTTLVRPPATMTPRKRPRALQFRLSLSLPSGVSGTNRETSLAEVLMFPASTRMPAMYSGCPSPRDVEHAACRQTPLENLLI